MSAETTVIVRRARSYGWRRKAWRLADERRFWCWPAQRKTGCTAERFGHHDYSEPPHTTPDEPLISPYGDDGDCEHQAANGPPWCTHTRDYVVVVYQAGTHEWIQIEVCTPCIALMRRRHAAWMNQDSLLGTKGLHSIRPVSRV